MAVNLQAIIDAPIIQLDTIDSTNNYAMRLIDADTAQPGLTIFADSQTSGKGQRGNQWVDAPAQSLLMSIIISPVHLLADQFVYNACVTVAIANTLQNLCENVDVRIKWPNDIILNDKKAGGVLVENVLRGNEWSYSIVGIGLNIAQKDFPDTLPHATSLCRESGNNYNVHEFGIQLRNNILEAVYKMHDAKEMMQHYNDHLYKRLEEQDFTKGQEVWTATILQACKDGQLEVQLSDGSIASYTHGSVMWKW